MLHIAADENIPYAEQAFSTLGKLEILPGSQISREKIRDADALVVRAVTPVNHELLDNTRVQFVGTATIGTDHLDTEYLRQAGVAFASAAGCNADAVAEYVFTAIAQVAADRGLRLPGSTIGIVGVGNIGGRIKKLARILGMDVLLNDPPLQRQTGDPEYAPLEKLLDADFLTFHVPLNVHGEDKTYHLLDAERLQKLRPDVILLNTSRGAVIDNEALIKWAQRHPDATLVLDVWENEPALHRELLARVDWGTPHIAGYSLQGKINGTYLVHRALCRHFSLTPEWQPPVLPKNEQAVSVRGDAGIELALHQATQPVFPLERDHQNLQKMQDLSPEDGAVFFERLRKNYPLRSEFSSQKVRLEPMDINIAMTLSAFRFEVVG
ncbi:MAG: 4-phosphoerythronate dehydrogenase [Deferribacteres bacterium]|nr:4-phosphoerythronate dehydrogenase [Deferribacteres bacterium]